MEKQEVSVVDEEDNIFKIYVENKKLNNNFGCVTGNEIFGWCGCTLLPDADNDLKKILEEC